MSKAVDLYNNAVASLSNEEAADRDAEEALERAAIERGAPLVEELEALIKAGAPLKMGAGGWMKRAGKLNLARELICARTPSSRTYKTLLISTIADDTRVYLRNGTAGGSDDNLHGYCLVARERKNGLGTLDDLWEDIATWLARGQ